MCQGRGGRGLSGSLTTSGCAPPRVSDGPGSRACSSALAQRAVVNRPGSPTVPAWGVALGQACQTPLHPPSAAPRGRLRAFVLRGGAFDNNSVITNQIPPLPARQVEILDPPGRGRSSRPRASSWPLKPCSHVPDETPCRGCRMLRVETGITR